MTGGRSPHGGRGLKPHTLIHPLLYCRSLPSRGAWIETTDRANEKHLGRSSLPSRGAWIETVITWNGRMQGWSRSPHGGRGLKRSWPGQWRRPRSRSPHGGRGLKQLQHRRVGQSAESLPSRGAWIETMPVAFVSNFASRSPHGGRGLKPPPWTPRPGSMKSLPSRGAWIETYSCNTP